ncbi:MAG TPA: pyridoxal phosphate-dependent aminotransferase [Chloroflexia bacterium]|nr:pyridoxal phosphate-dependent aminotransferase [Chloroflexia bacterium]
MTSLHSHPLPGPAGDPPAGTPAAQMVDLRRQVVARTGPSLARSPSPIRAMARMVDEVIVEARGLGLPDAAIQAAVINRSIGDVNVRQISEVYGGVDYSTIGEDLGIILPGEVINGRVSDGRTYLELRERMLALERRLLTEYHFDSRIYDLSGVGNPLLRERLAARCREQYGIPATPEQTFVSIGGLDAIDKSLRGLNQYFRETYGGRVGFAFPAPGFSVPLWQATNLDMDVITFPTREEDRFQLTAETMARLLHAHPNLRVLYLTVSNNPTAFAYPPEELRAVLDTIARDGRELAIIADLAYVGTGPAADDRARMAAFLTPDALQRTLFVSSFSKVFTLTGDRMGYISIANPAWASLLTGVWNNANAGMPGEWQLRFLAYTLLFDERPWIQAKIRDLYTLRREALRQELAALNRVYHVFEHIGLDDHATVYNWSKLAPGETAFSFFEKTGIAGVDGRAFGYDPRYLRLSVGFIPVPPDQLAALVPAP